MNPNVFNREPAFWVGLAASILLAVIQQLVGNEVLTPETGVNLTSLVTSLVPLVAALVTRYFVTPTAAPRLPEGQEVTIQETGEVGHVAVSDGL